MLRENEKVTEVRQESEVIDLEVPEDDNIFGSFLDVSGRRTVITPDPAMQENRQSITQVCFEMFYIVCILLILRKLVGFSVKNQV